jgi:hypothetical protein
MPPEGQISDAVDITKVLKEQYPGEPETRDYLEQVSALSSVPTVSSTAS